MIQFTSQEGYYGYNKDNRFVAEGYDVVVEKYERELESGNIFVTVSFYVGDQLQTVRSTINDMVKSMCLAGYPVSNAQTTSLFQYIQQQMDELDAEIVHKQLGWLMVDNSPVFRGETTIGNLKTPSHYIGSYDVLPRGTIQDFKNDFAKTILGNTPLETAAVMGMSAVLVGYIATMFKNERVPTLILDINGRSTTGKTTSANLAVSMGGAVKPSDDLSSLSGTCSTTENALYGTLNNNYGFPILFDEIARLGRANIDAMIYAIADGTDKARMNSEGKVNPPKRWATVVLFTGEHQMLSGKSVADGIYMRVLSFNNVEWTSSAAQAHAVEQFSTDYAGIANMALANYLTKAVPDDILRLYQQKVSSLTTKLPVTACYKERLAKSAAVLLTTAELAEKAFNITLGKQAILDFLLDNISGHIPENEAQKAFYYVLNQYYINFSKFIPAPLPKGNTETFSRHDTWGTYRTATVKQSIGKSNIITEEISIVKEIFLKWMEKGNFENVNNILREWKKLDILHLQKKDHYYSNVSLKVGYPSTLCIRIKINNGVYPLNQVIGSDERFTEVLCRTMLKKGLEHFERWCNDYALISSMNRDIEYLANGGKLQHGLSEEIIQNCFEINVDMRKITSYLHGADYNRWKAAKDKEVKMLAKKGISTAEAKPRSDVDTHKQHDTEQLESGEKLPNEDISEEDIVMSDEDADFYDF